MPALGSCYARRRFTWPDSISPGPRSRPASTSSCGTGRSIARTLGVDAAPRRARLHAIPRQHAHDRAQAAPRRDLHEHQPLRSARRVRRRASSRTHTSSRTRSSTSSTTIACSSSKSGARSSRTGGDDPLAARTPLLAVARRSAAAARAAPRRLRVDSGAAVLAACARDGGLDAPTARTPSTGSCAARASSRSGWRRSSAAPASAPSAAGCSIG